MSKGDFNSTMIAVESARLTLQGLVANDTVHPFFEVEVKTALAQLDLITAKAEAALQAVMDQATS